jgi:hypothetical protein
MKRLYTCAPSTELVKIGSFLPGEHTNEMLKRSVPVPEKT